MKIYSVFLRPDLAPAQALEGMQLVKQGLHWEAALITPFWAIRQSLWLALSLWIGSIAAIGLVAAAAHLNAAAILLLYLICALAFGLEADRLRQARLAQAGFLMQGLTFGASSRDAEAVYMTTRESAPPAKLPNDPLSGRSSPLGGSAADMDLLGLFPSRESGL